MLRVITWGTRGSIPVSGPRFAAHGGATTCIGIEVPGAAGRTPRRVILDCGTGLAELGRRWGDREPEALFLQTHMHWDHIQGFPFFGPLFRSDARLELWARDRDGFSLRDALRAQMRRPTFPVDLDAAPAALSFRTIEAAGRADLGELSLAWTELCHPSGCTAFRVERRGAAVVFTGDADVQEGGREALVDLARGADVLICDAQYLPAEYAARRGFGHSTPLEAVSVAIDAGVGRLLLTHHDPGHDDACLEAKLHLARRAAGDRVRVDSARDGLELAVAASGVAGAPRA